MERDPLEEATEYVIVTAAKAGIKFKPTEACNDAMRGYLQLRSDVLMVNLEYSGEENYWTVARQDCDGCCYYGNNLQEIVEEMAQDIREEIGFLKESFLL